MALLILNIIRNPPSLISRSLEDFSLIHKFKLYVDDASIVHGGPLEENFPKLASEYSSLHFVYVIDLYCPFDMLSRVSVIPFFSGIWKYLIRGIEIDGFNV